MEINTALEKMRALLTEHRLTEQGWTVGLDRAKRRLGKCSYSQKRVSLSINHIRFGTDEEVMNTIRHEVAHAIAGPGTKHGPVWKQWARILGARPRACTKDLSYKPSYKFVVRCKCCGLVIQKRYNAVSRKRLQRLYHNKCGMISIGQLTLHRFTNESQGLLQPA